MKAKLSYPAAAAMALLVCAGMQTSAVTEKLLEKIGVSGIDPKISSLVSTMLAPADNAASSDVNKLISAGIALLLLAAFGALLFNIGKIMMGSRGGGQAVLGVLGGLVAAIACVQVLA